MVLLVPACMVKNNGSAMCSRKGPVDGLHMQAKEADLTLASPGSGAVSEWSFSVHDCAPVGTRVPLMLLSADGLPCDMSMTP